MTLGYNARITEEQIVEDYTFDRYLYPEFYDSYNTKEISSFIEDQNYDASTNHGGNVAKEINPIETTQPLDGPMDSPWPMQGHDVRHTGRSPHSTADNPYDEKWRYKLSGISYHCAPIIDNEGVIYVGREDFYAINPNGTLKWKFDTSFSIVSAPAINENGVIYVGTAYGEPNYLYAIYTNNGTLKWKFKTDSHICSSPAIGTDGAIYFGSDDDNIYAINPNGTLKWKFTADHIVFSSPAIGADGTIYFGSIDNYVYALYPNNGTLKWKFNTGTWVHGSATIGDDGTIYIGSDNGNLYAFYPNNGTVKWQCNIGEIWGSPALDEDGNIYVGTWRMKFFAVYPNGTIKWSYNAPGRIWFGSSAALSANGIIYFGTTWQDGGNGAFIVLNPDGTERFREDYGLFETSPAIGSDGNVYICSSHYEQGENFGYLHAIGKLDHNAPSSPDINGPTNGNAGTKYDFTFISTSPLGRDVYYYITWGDGSVENWVGPYNSGEVATFSHTWSSQGTYTIEARAKDTDNLWGPWSEFSVNMKVRNRATSNMLFLRFLEQFPLMREVLLRLITR